jgi:lantibiotic biosynthesis protein
MEKGYTVVSMTRTEPLLDAALARRAEELLDTLSRALVDVVPAALGGGSLARGSAGLALAHAHLHPIFPERGHDDAALRALEDAIGRLPLIETPFLLPGFAGIAWVVHLLADDLADTPGGPCWTADELLRKLVAREAALPFEAVSGVGGLAAYAVERLPRDDARAVLTSVGRHLAQRASGVGEDVSWSAPFAPGRRAVPPGTQVVDYGFAHGVPGVLGTLALLHAHAPGNDADSLLRRATASFLGRRAPKGSASAFAVSSFDAPAPARTAWCYGDPGAAWGLFLAGRALGEDAIVAASVEVASATATRPEPDSGVVEMGFCHGAAGVAHVLARMEAATGDPSLRAAARIWIERLLALQHPSAEAGGVRSVGESSMRPDVSLLGGAAGVALVVGSALGLVDSGWDRGLMLVGEDDLAGDQR